MIKVVLASISGLVVYKLFKRHTQERQELFKRCCGSGRMESK